MSRSTSIRWGAAAIALAGVLFLAYPAVRPWHDETTVSGATASMSSNAWVAAHFFAMAGFILLPLGLMALTTLTSGTRAHRPASAATVTTWIGAGLTLPYYGAEDFGLHAIAGPKGRGADLLHLIDAVRYQPLAMTVFGAGLILLAVGSILAAVAVWRSGVLPRWSGVLYAVGFALFLPQFFGPAPVRIIHGAVTAIGAIVLAATMWSRSQRPAVEVATPVTGSAEMAGTHR
jgi:hypothetical protein